MSNGICSNTYRQSAPKPLYYWHLLIGTAPYPLYYWHLLIGHGVGNGKRLQYGRRVYQMEFCSNTYRHFVPKPLYYWHLYLFDFSHYLHHDLFTSANNKGVWV